MAEDTSLLSSINPYRKYIEGAWGTAKRVSKSPLDVLRGGTVDAVSEALQALGGHALSAVQAVSPVAVPGAKDPLPQGLAQRAGSLSNALLLGMPDMFTKRWKEAQAESGQASNLEQQLEDLGRGAGSFLLKDVLPGEMIGENLTGQAAQGGELSARKYGSNITLSALQLLPFFKGVGRVKGVPARATRMQNYTNYGKLVEETAESYASKGDIKAANLPEGSGAFPIDEIIERVGKDTAHTIAVDLPQEYAQKFKIEGAVSAEEVAGLVREVASSSVFQEYTNAIASGKVKTHEAIISAIQQKALNPEKIAELSAKYSLPTELTTKRVVDIVSKVFDKTAEAQGAGNKVLSDLKKVVDGITAERAHHGDPLAIEAVRRAWKEPPDSSTTYAQRVYNWINSGSKTIENLRRRLITSSPVTAFRNAQVGWLETSIISPFEQLIGDIGHSLIMGEEGVLRKGGETRLGFMRTSAWPSNFRLYQQIEPVLKALPKAYDYFFENVNEGVVRDSFADFLKSRQKGGKPGAKKLSPQELVEVAVDMSNMGNRFQEMWFRKLSFAQRMYNNMRELGVEGDNVLGQTAEILGNKDHPLHQRAKEAWVDSGFNAMKETFAYSPEAGSFPAKLMEIYKVIPFATAVLPTFPRFIYNQWRWMFEHNPLRVFEVLSPEYKKFFSDPAANIWAKKEAARTIGKATTGAMMLGLAYALRSSPLAGPNYYDLRAGEDKDTFMDVRSMQPFASWLFIADRLQVAEGTKSDTLNSNELLDAVAGVRRVSDVPLLNLPGWLEGVYSGNPETALRTWKKPVGNWIGSFLRPWDFWVNKLPQAGVEWALDGDPRDGAIRDVQGQELTGPAREALAFPLKHIAPGADLPVKSDPFTGKPYTQQNKLAYFLTGANTKEKSKLQQLLERNGLELNRIIGDYSTPEANSAIREKMGEVFSKQIEGGSLGDVLAQRVEEAQLNPEVTQFILTELINEVEGDVYKGLKKSNPELMLKKEVQTSKQLGPFKEDILKKLKQTQKGVR